MTATDTTFAATTQRRHPFHIMLKPIGPICNLDCTYCYYLHKEGLLFGKGEKWKMALERMENYIRQYIESQAHLGEIGFAWQGGEPTLLGVDYFRHIVDLQKKYAPPGVRITNALQTNGTLVDDEWGEFFASNNFLIGLSIDGPRDLHDIYRVDKGGKPSFDKVMAGLAMLKKHGCEYNALVVLNRRNSKRPTDVYRFLRDEAGFQFMQFIPCVERVDFDATAPQTWDAKSLPVLGQPKARPSGSPDALVTEWSVEPEAYGTFLCEVFDDWLVNDVGQIFVQVFDVALGQWMGLGSSLCVFAEECGSAMAMEHDGSLYSCDHFVYPEFKLGNIDDKPLAEMVDSEFQQQFGRDKKAKLPRYCRECEVRFACNGECPKNRFIRTPEGEPGLNYLCAGLRKFFNHVNPWMQRMAGELRAGRPAANVMQMARAQRQAAGMSGAAPNDPCPCGSGRKFKKCCMRKSAAR